MAFHPIPARWFEILVPRRSVARVMEALARTGQVEFEAAEGTEHHDLSSLRSFLTEYERILQEFGGALPPPDTAHRLGDRPLDEVAREALGRLRSWVEEAGPEIRALEVAVRRQAELTSWQEIFSRLAALDPGLAFNGAAEPGLKLEIRLFLLPPDCEPDLDGTLRVCRVLEVDGRRFLLAAGTERSIAELTREMNAAGARRFELPEWARGAVAEMRDEATRRLADCTAEAERIRAALREAETRHRVPQALGDMIRIAWVSGEMEKLPVTENLGWITGWTSARGEETLRGPLERLGLPHAFSFTEPPPERTPPSILLNPPWARPFELFARLLGTPAVQEADPSIFLSVIAPLLFGYMFGDIGHGAVLLIAGLVLRSRFPVMALLVPGGAAAIGFGFLFGEMFGMHVLPALWLKPLQEPLVLLFAPLVGGGVIIALGLLLDGVTALWRRMLWRWLLRDLGLVIAYGGLWGLLVDPRSVWIAALGVLWYVTGHLTDRLRPPFAALMQGAGALAENALRLLVNTISFVRVGAFALAHAGLGVAVANLAEAAGPGGQWPVLILGNLFIIVIEGLVVSVQTTRLILFEFFIRFLQATGRPFRPSLPPDWAGTEAQATRGVAA